MKWNGLSIALLLFFSSYGTFAQNNFVEGELVYAISIESANATQISSTGTLTLMLKGNSIVKILELNKGYKNTIIYNGFKKSTHSLRSIGDKKVALLLEAEQIKKIQEKCSSLRIEDIQNEPRAILNFKTELGIIHCNNASPLTLYYTKDWQIKNANLFDEFPSFQYLPLLFDIKNEDGSKVHFELKKIEAKPMENSIFEIPKDYKVISSEEYNSWQH